MNHRIPYPKQPVSTAHSIQIRFRHYHLTRLLHAAMMQMQIFYRNRCIHISIYQDGVHQQPRHPPLPTLESCDSIDPLQP